MAKDEDRHALQQRFSALTAQDRRAVAKAVNRGRAVENRKHAPLAIHIANRQMRFWRWSWLIGPAVGLLQIRQLGPAAAVVNMVMASAALGAMSAFFYLRAQRSAQINAELLPRRKGPPRPATQSAAGTEPGRRRWSLRRGGRGRDGATGGDGAGKGGSGKGGSAESPRPRGHLPGRDGRAAGGASTGEDHGSSSRTPTADEQGDSDAPPPVRRPYQPRGRKRRGH